MIRSSIRRWALSTIVSLVLTPAVTLAPGAASAADSPTADQLQEPSLEGLYYDWSLYGMQENGNLVCYLASNLERSSDPTARRQPAHVLITNRPAEGKRAIVSVIPGYTYEPDGVVLLTVGRKQFHLFADRGAAWAQDAEDPQIVAAIRGGSTLVVTGRMKDGPTTTDVFSLKGFGPALTALDRACPVAVPASETIHRKRKKKR